MHRTMTLDRAGSSWGAFAGAAAFVAITLTASGARAQGAPSAQAPPPPATPVVIEVSKPVELEVKNKPRVITDWEEGEPVPSGYHPVQRARKGAIVGGAVPLAVLYFLSALVAATNHDANHGASEPTDGLFIPIAGPFITMTQSSSAVAGMFLVIDGIGQAGGAALLVYGLTSPKTVLMRDDYGVLPLVPKPMRIGRDGAGLGWSGAF